MKYTGNTLTLNGISGDQYLFGLYTFEDFSELRNVFLSRAAVYVFTRRRVTSDGFTHDLVYLGETSDLSSRFKNYHKEQDIIAHYANCIGIHGLASSEEKRKFIEKDILTAYDFPCNDSLNK